MHIRLCWCVLITACLSACGPDVAPRNLDELVLQDSLYLEPTSLEPYTGPVFRPFADEPGTNQVEGVLASGLWNGEIRVYHENGRLRYQGWLTDGEKCGAWIENRDAEPPGDVLAELKQEVESMGLYAPCPDT